MGTPGELKKMSLCKSGPFPAFFGKKKLCIGSTKITGMLQDFNDTNSIYALIVSVIKNTIRVSISGAMCLWNTFSLTEILEDFHDTNSI